MTRIACSMAGTSRALLILSDVTRSQAFAGSNARMSTWASPRYVVTIAGVRAPTWNRGIGFR